MRTGLTSTLALAGALLLAGCGETGEDVIDVVKIDPAADEAPDVSEPDDAAKPDEPELSDDEIAEQGDAETWAGHMGDIAFVIGPEKGFAKAKAEGKPVLLFYTATW